MGKWLFDHSEPLCYCHSKVSNINTNVLLQIYIYILSIVMCLSVVHSFAFFFSLLKQLFKCLLLFSILKFCFHSNKGASKMKRGKSYFDA